MPENDTVKAAKKPLHKRMWFWVVVVVVVAAIAGGANGSKNVTKTSEPPTQVPVAASGQSDAGASATEGESAQKSEKPSIPTEYTSALKKATSYATAMHMSKQAVYDQLTSEYGEQFSEEAAQYAIDNVVADWNANALAKAKSYQEKMSMSPSAIYDQLTSEYGEKFTEEEADYAISNL